MRNLAQAAALTAAVCSLGACATVTRGYHTAWEVKTTPPGAAVKTTNSMQCDSTPCSLTMTRNSEFDATITKAGYKSLTIHVTHKISTGGGVGMAGNVILGGVIGVVVDASSGAMFDLTPNPVEVVLEKDDAPVAPTPAPPAVAQPAPATPTSPTENAPY